MTDRQTYRHRQRFESAGGCDLSYTVIVNCRFCSFCTPESQSGEDCRLARIEDFPQNIPRFSFPFIYRRDVDASRL